MSAAIEIVRMPEGSPDGLPEMVKTTDNSWVDPETVRLLLSQVHGQSRELEAADESNQDVTGHFESSSTDPLELEPLSGEELSEQANKYFKMAHRTLAETNLALADIAEELAQMSQDSKTPSKGVYGVDREFNALEAEQEELLADQAVQLKQVQEFEQAKTIQFQRPIVASAEQEPEPQSELGEIETTAADMPDGLGVDVGSIATAFKNLGLGSSMEAPSTSAMARCNGRASPGTELRGFWEASSSEVPVHTEVSPVTYISRADLPNASKQGYIVEETPAAVEPAAELVETHQPTSDPVEAEITVELDAVRTGSTIAVIEAETLSDLIERPIMPELEIQHGPLPSIFERILKKMGWDQRNDIDHGSPDTVSSDKLAALTGHTPIPDWVVGPNHYPDAAHEIPTYLWPITYPNQGNTTGSESRDSLGKEISPAELTVLLPAIPPTQEATQGSVMSAQKRTAILRAAANLGIVGKLAGSLEDTDVLSTSSPTSPNGITDNLRELMVAPPTTLEIYGKAAIARVFTERQLDTPGVIGLFGGPASGLLGDSGDEGNQASVATHRDIEPVTPPHQFDLEA